MIRAIIAASVCILAACSTPQTTVVKEQQIVVIKTPEALLQTTAMPEPPKKDIYKLAPVQERETMLVDYSISLMSGLYRCNNMINDIREFQLKAIDIERKKHE